MGSLFARKRRRRRNRIMRLLTFLIHILLPLSCMFTASHGFISSKPSSYQSRMNRRELRRNNGHYVQTMLKETVKSEESKSDKVVAEEEMSETQKNDGTSERSRFGRNNFLCFMGIRVLDCECPSLRLR